MMQQCTLPDVASKTTMKRMDGVVHSPVTAPARVRVVEVKNREPVCLDQT